METQELPALPELPLLELPIVEDMELPQPSVGTDRSLSLMWRGDPSGELSELPGFGAAGTPAATPPHYVLPELASLELPRFELLTLSESAALQSEAILADGPAMSALPAIASIDASESFEGLPLLDPLIKQHELPKAALSWPEFTEGSSAEMPPLPEISVEEKSSLLHAPLPELSDPSLRLVPDEPLLTSAWESELPGPDLDEMLPPSRQTSSPGLPALTPAAFHASIEMAKSDAWDFNALPAMESGDSEGMPEIEAALADLGGTETSPVDKLSGLLTGIAKGISQLVEMADTPREPKHMIRYSSRFEQ